MLGKTLLYRITVQSIKERELLPLDDELGASIGGRPMTLAELRAEIRSGLHQQKEMQARNTLVNTIMEKLRDDVAKVEIGPALINQQTQEDAAQQLQQIGGMGLDINEIFGRNTDALNNFLERIRPESERRLRNTLILREIGEHEEIDVTPDDVHEEVHRLGMSHERPRRRAHRRTDRSRSARAQAARPRDRDRHRGHGASSTIRRRARTSCRPPMSTKTMTRVRSETVYRTMSRLRRRKSPCRRQKQAHTLRRPSLTKVSSI